MVSTCFFGVCGRIENCSKAELRLLTETVAERSAWSGKLSSAVSSETKGIAGMLVPALPNKKIPMICLAKSECVAVAGDSEA